MAGIFGRMLRSPPSSCLVELLSVLLDYVPDLSVEAKGGERMT